MELLAILRVGRVEGRLFNLKLPFEQVDWVLKGWIGYSVHWYSEWVVLVGRSNDVFKQLVDDDIELVLHLNEFLCIFVSDFLLLSLDKLHQICWVLEMKRVGLSIDDLLCVC